MKKLTTWILALSAVFLVACEKDVIKEVRGNTPPEDPTISYNQRDQYIEKVYITLLGRKPDSTEHASARAFIDVNPQDSAIRYQWMGNLFLKRSASVKRWDDIRSELLESTDTTAIAELIFNLQVLMQSAPPEQQFIYQNEIDRLERINYAADSLFAGVYTVVDLHRYSVDNYVYDQINMGTENFVVSVFDHFLYRYPTQYELESGKRIVDGFQDLLFLQSGQGKQDFLDIFFSSASYAEGQVRYVYLNYLFRDPSSSELIREKAHFISSHDFQDLQRRLLATDEYFFQ